MDIKENFSIFLKAKREQLSMTQESMANLLDIPTNTYKSYEYQKSIPMADAILSIILKLDCTFEEMFCGPNYATPEAQLLKTLKLISPKIEYIASQLGTLGPQINKILKAKRDSVIPPDIVTVLEPMSEEKLKVVRAVINNI